VTSTATTAPSRPGSGSRNTTGVSPKNAGTGGDGSEKARPGDPQLGPHDPAVAGVEVDAGRGAEVEGRALERLRREHETGTEGADLGVAVAVLARVRQPGEGLQERLAERGGEAKALADGAGRAEAERVGVAARRDRDAAEGENARRVDPGAVDADEALGFPAA
jgi:hypothetical protein